MNLDRNGQLSEAEIKAFVVDNKWLVQLAAAVQSELDRVSQALTGRIKQLAERYAVPLPQLVDELETLGNAVVERLSADLRSEFPDMTGFSPRNLWDFKRFYETYAAAPEKLRQAVAETSVPTRRVEWIVELFMFTIQPMIGAINFQT